MGNRSGRRLSTAQKQTLRKRRDKRAAKKDNIKRPTRFAVPDEFREVQWAIEQFSLAYLAKFEPDKTTAKYSVSSIWNSQLDPIPFLVALFKRDKAEFAIAFEKAIYAGDMVELHLVGLGHAGYLRKPPYFTPNPRLQWSCCFANPTFFAELAKMLEEAFVKFIPPLPLCNTSEEDKSNGQIS